MKRMFISTILILAGLYIMAYPKIIEIFHEQHQQKLIEEWEDSLSIIDHGYMEDEEDIGDIIETQNVNYQEENPTVGQDLVEIEVEAIDEEKKKEEEKRAREEYVKKNMDGILKIEKINLNLPILKGATKKNLLISVASLENIGEIGEIGNYAIAGHRNRTYGRNFNRLDEVEEGDLIQVQDGKNQYEYTVVEKLYVLPEETWVLSSNKKDKEITLITCHPMKNPTHRLIVKGKIVE